MLREDSMNRSTSLQSITSLKKLCNRMSRDERIAETFSRPFFLFELYIYAYANFLFQCWTDVLVAYIDPALIYEKMREGEGGMHGTLELLPPGFSPKRFMPELSGKMMVGWKRYL